MYRTKYVVLWVNNNNNNNKNKNNNNNDSDVFLPMIIIIIIIIMGFLIAHVDYKKLSVNET